MDSNSSAPARNRDYFRRDQRDGVSAPDLTKDSSFADHIVHARGKRTKYTSLTLDLERCRDFGECSYHLLRESAEENGHRIIEHEQLLQELQRAAAEAEKSDRLKAIQAIRYAKLRKEGLVDWQFDCSRVERKDVIGWAYRQIQGYFARL